MSTVETEKEPFEFGKLFDSIQEELKKKTKKGEEPTLITDEVFLGGNRSALAIGRLQSLGITDVLHCAHEPPKQDATSMEELYSNTMAYHGISCQDDESYPILALHWKECHKVLTAILNKSKSDDKENKEATSEDSNSKSNQTSNSKKRKVLICCQAGMNRSVTVCVATLVEFYHMSLTDAIALVHSKRHPILQNDGFIKELITKYHHTVRM